jgi:hypothetical protein
MKRMFVATGIVLCLAIAPQGAQGQDVRLEQGAVGQQEEVPTEHHSVMPALAENPPADPSETGDRCEQKVRVQSKLIQVLERRIHELERPQSQR